MWNKDVTIDHLLDESQDEEDKNPDDHEEWYKKLDWWKNRKTETYEDSDKKETEPMVGK